MTVAPCAMPAESIRLPDTALHVAGKRHQESAEAWVMDPWTGERVAPVILAGLARVEQAASSWEATLHASYTRMRRASPARSRRAAWRRSQRWSARAPSTTRDRSA